MSIWDKLTDNEGLFRGGKKGRFLGRFRDEWDESAGLNKPQKEERVMSPEELSAHKQAVVDSFNREESFKRAPDYANTYEGVGAEQIGMNPGNLNMLADMTRRMDSPGESFDNFSLPEAYKGFRQRLRTQNFQDLSNKEMTNMQRWLNELGYTDAAGAELEEDGMFGAKTLSAIRKAQGKKFDIPGEYEGESVSPDYDDPYGTSEETQEDYFKNYS